MSTKLTSSSSLYRHPGAFLVLLGSVLIVPASLQASTTETESGNVAAPPAAPADQLRPSERAFLEQARAVVNQQRRLGELGVGHAANSEVRSHAQQIAADFRRLSEAIEGLIRKKGIALLKVADTPSAAYTAVTEKSGADFDRLFVMTLVELHESTSALFDAATADAKDTDVRDFASAQLPMLREHRNRITRLRSSFD